MAGLDEAEEAAREAMRDDKGFMLEAVKNDGRALMHATEAPRDPLSRNLNSHPDSGAARRQGTRPVRSAEELECAAVCEPCTPGGCRSSHGGDTAHRRKPGRKN